MVIQYYIVINICDTSGNMAFISPNYIVYYYLGMITNSSMKTSFDVVRKFYAQANMLLCNFRYCTNDVKCMFFKSFCANMYCTVALFGLTPLHLVLKS